MEVPEVGGVNAFDAGLTALVSALSLVGAVKGLTRLAVGMTALAAASVVAAAPARAGWADRPAGSAAGLAGAVLIAGSAAVPVLAYVPAGDRLLAESHLAPYAVVGADAAAALAPAGLAAWYGERMDAVRRFWRERAERSRGPQRPGPGRAPPLDPQMPRLPWR